MFTTPWPCRYLPFFIPFLALTPAKPAQIELLPPSDNEVAGITIVGDFKIGDDAAFANVAIKFQRAVVFFHSNGGALYPAIQIGKAIRLKGFATAVVDGSQCVSACAIAWLGGVTRLMGSNAKIGFHAAYNVQNGQALVNSAGNAIVGGYLNQLGLSEGAIAYVTSAGPETAQWLTISEAQRYGIEVSILPALSETANSRPLPFSNPGLKPPARPSYENSLQIEAELFMQQFLQTETEPLEQALKHAEIQYADTVFHYGKVKTKAEVLHEFGEFILRWPKRTYTVKPGSAKISCSEFTQTCSYDCILDWTAESYTRNKRSVGTSTWSVRLQKIGNGFVVVARNGSVTDRHVSDILGKTLFDLFQ